MKKRKKDSKVRVRFNVNNMTKMNRGSREELLGSSQEALRNSQHDLRHAYEKPLTREEKTYLLHADRGDYATVKRLIEQYSSNSEVLDINCVDPLNRSALIAAIENENIELIKLLLGAGILVKDALLHAIKEEYVEAVELLLQWEEEHHVPGDPYSWESVDPASATFTPDITPLILAAHRNHYEILKILLDRGATLPIPHDVKCGCDECVKSSQEDSLRHSQARINAYRALTSPSLIALSSADPLLTAFQLSWELGRLSRMETEFRVEYKALRHQCQEFATSLLDHTRTSNELEIMLNYNPWDTDTWEPGERQTLGRLKLAIKYKQKMFVAHPNVQQLLGAIWYEGLPGFKRKNIVGQCIQVAKLGVMFPVYCTIYMLAPNSEYGRFMKKPFVKFICHSSSYMLFLSFCSIGTVEEKRSNGLLISTVMRIKICFAFLPLLFLIVTGEPDPQIFIASTAIPLLSSPSQQPRIETKEVVAYLTPEQIKDLQDGQRVLKPVLEPQSDNQANLELVEIPQTRYNNNEEQLTEEEKAYIDIQTFVDNAKNLQNQKDQIPLFLREPEQEKSRRNHTKYSWYRKEGMKYYAPSSERPEKNKDDTPTENAEGTRYYDSTTEGPNIYYATTLRTPEQSRFDSYNYYSVYSHKRGDNINIKIIHPAHKQLEDDSEANNLEKQNNTTTRQNKRYRPNPQDLNKKFRGFESVQKRAQNSRNTPKTLDGRTILFKPSLQNEQSQSQDSRKEDSAKNVRDQENSDKNEENGEENIEENIEEVVIKPRYVFRSKIPKRPINIEDWIKQQNTAEDETTSSEEVSKKGAVTRKVQVPVVQHKDSDKNLDEDLNESTSRQNDRKKILDLLKRQNAQAQAATAGKLPVVIKKVSVTKQEKVPAPQPYIVRVPQPVKVKVSQTYSVPLEIIRHVPIQIEKTEGDEDERVSNKAKTRVLSPVNKKLYVKVNTPFFIERDVPNGEEDEE